MRRSRHPILLAAAGLLAGGLLALGGGPIVAADPGTSSITSNFNGTPIGSGDWIWFSSVVKVKGVGTDPVHVSFDASTVVFSADGVGHTLAVPSAQLTIDPNASTAVTSYDAGRGTWFTVMPPGTAGNVFLTGFAVHVPDGLPGGIKPVTWSGRFGSDTPGVTLQWQWAAAVYTSFTDDLGALGVKPVDDNHASAYANSDHAGTPEAFRSSVVGGARGGGGSNFTGSLSATSSVVPGAYQPPSDEQQSN